MFTLAFYRCFSLFLGWSLGFYFLGSNKLIPEELVT